MVPTGIQKAVLQSGQYYQNLESEYLGFNCGFTKVHLDKLSEVLLPQFSYL